MSEQLRICPDRTAADWHDTMRSISQNSPPREEKRITESERSAALESALQAWRMKE